MTALLGVIVLASALAAPPPLPAPALCSSASASVERPIGGHTDSVCNADCGPLNLPVSCSGSVCSAVNQSVSCPTGPGSVTCDGVTTYCAPCCTSGTFRTVPTGPNCSCPDGKTSPKDKYQCVNGLWQFQVSVCSGPFCQG